MMASTTGRIHSIETFGTVDGPGIRYIVFLQGCPLRCRYCHNRDTWDTTKGIVKSAEEIIQDVVKYKTYFDASGGGLTLSGGEPTLQVEFSTALFRLAKEKNIHTCLDTSGYTEISKIKKLLEFTDLVLLDIKHTDPKTSTWLTGHDSNNAIKLARYLSERNIPIWLRHVLVPGVTDDKENIIALAKLIRSLTNIEKFEFLPYHTMGVYKWKELDGEYGLEGIREANERDIGEAKKLLLENGVDPRLINAH